MIDYQSVVVTPFAQNCRIFLNHDTHEAMVCDPGDSAQKIYSAIKSAGYSIKTILITHMHLDHVGGVSELQKLSGAKVIGSAAEDEPVKRALKEQSYAFGLAQCDSFDNEYVKDGDDIEVFTDLSFKVIATPGHTPGGVCYYSEKMKLVLSGDSLFAGSIGRTDFPLGDTDALISSIREKLYALPDETQVLSGHGPDSSIGEEKRSNFYVTAL